MAAWGTQHARQISRFIRDEGVPVRFLIRDRGAMFPPAFNTECAGASVTIIGTPYRKRKTSAVSECWLQSVREKYLDHFDDDECQAA
jgi:hypothetical protein